MATGLAVVAINLKLWQLCAWVPVVPKVLQRLMKVAEPGQP